MGTRQDIHDRVVHPILLQQLPKDSKPLISIMPKEGHGWKVGKQVQYAAAMMYIFR